MAGATLLLTPQLADTLVAAVRRAVPIETAVQAAGVSQPQFYAWLKVAESGAWPDGNPAKPETISRLTEFASRVRAAQAELEAEHIQAINDAGSVIGRSGVPEWRARAWLLNNHPRTRERYRQHREVEVHQSGTIALEHTLTARLPDLELEKAYDVLHALPASSDSSALEP